MSMLLMVKAMNLKVGNPLRKLVLIKLADNANDNGECWPSYQHVADQCEISRSSVKFHVRALEMSGLIKREMRPGEKGNSSNMFYLSLDNPGQELPGVGQELPGVGQELPGVGQELPGGGAGAARGWGAGAAPRTSHSFEPVIEPVMEPKDLLPSKLDCEVKQVIGLLNSLTGSRYQASAKTNTANISARLKDGHSLDDLLAVVRFKCAEWLHDPKMSQYLRPGTLFQPGKFDGYLTATRAAQSPLAEMSAISRKNAQNLAGDW